MRAATAAAVEATSLRELMRRYASGVSVVTAPPSAGRVVGTTITSFVSISIDPDVVAVSLHSGGRTARAVGAAGVFAVNVLGAAQIDLARAFAAPGAARPDLTAHETMRDVPVGLGNVGFVLCETISVTPVVDHDVVMARVIASRATTAEPLVYFDRGYRRIAEATVPPDDVRRTSERS
ncbi:flavin reductase family protein [Microbacterium aurantiacum]|uniref:Flavin reductase family protein n=1 Tax=Microbacterium aurantiacum TaxID=162393 RepID=A0AAJ2LXK4_9MICO|nr:flavin reductase family protein [Microbacterium aurantiacum]MDS0246972.1 flavin reductase family protein [Microbacterium aurantiacum]